jgi:hypothetical protein
LTRLWKVQEGALREVGATSPKAEAQIEGWVADEPRILGLDLLIIARQYVTDHGGRIDLLGMDSEGDLTLIELKRDRTAREVIAQTLDYGSWVRGLATPRIHNIASAYLKRPLSEAFRERFDLNVPETLNSNHNLLIVASGFDDSSRRIVEYLAEVHGVSINTAFFTFFRDGDQEFLASDFLMDQEEVVQRSEAKTKAPWTGYYYVNVGDGPHRSWEDMRRYGFVAAGHGRFYSVRLQQLSPGDPIFCYQKGAGYVGYGTVRSPVVKVDEFATEGGVSLSELELKQPGIFDLVDDPEMAEYVVGVDWHHAVPISDARWLDGGFANQNIVCKLRHSATISFLEREFGVKQTQSETVRAG